MSAILSRPTALVEQSRVIDKKTIRLYAELTDDFNPIHVDEKLAEKTPFGRTISHGTLTLALVWQAFDITFGRDVLAGAEVDIRFVKPVLADTRVTASGSMLADSAGHVWHIQVKSDAGVVVISGTVRLARGALGLPGGGDTEAGTGVEIAASTAAGR